MSSKKKTKPTKALSHLLVQYRAPARTTEGKLIYESRERRIVIDADETDPEATIRRILAVADYSTPKVAQLIEVTSAAAVVS
jgi:hypothetical protein